MHSSLLLFSPQQTPRPYGSLAHSCICLLGRKGTQGRTSAQLEAGGPHVTFLPPPSSHREERTGQREQLQPHLCAGTVLRAEGKLWGHASEGTLGRAAHTPQPRHQHRTTGSLQGQKAASTRLAFSEPAGGGRAHTITVQSQQCGAPPLPANSVSALLHLRARPASLLMDTDQEASLWKRREGQRATGMKPEHAWLTKGPNRLGTDDLTSTAADQEQRKQAQGSLLLEVISIHVVDGQMHPSHSPGMGSQRQG